MEFCSWCWLSTTRTGTRLRSCFVLRIHRLAVCTVCSQHYVHVHTKSSGTTYRSWQLREHSWTFEGQDSPWDWLGWWPHSWHLQVWNHYEGKWGWELLPTDEISNTEKERSVFFVSWIRISQTRWPDDANRCSLSLVIVDWRKLRRIEKQWSPTTLIEAFQTLKKGPCWDEERLGTFSVL